MGLVTIVPLVEVISFGLWSSMPMGVHKSRTTKHHHWSGKGFTTISIGYKVFAHSSSIQIILQIYIWETTSTCSCKQRINCTQHPTLLS